MNKVLLKLTVCFFFFSPIIGQNKSYTGIKNLYGNAIRTITDNNEVKGYTIFSCLDKVNEKENIYQLLIFDNMLNDTLAIELKKSNTIVPIENSFNGDHFCFSFLDSKAKKLEYLFVDKTGKETGKYSITDLSMNEMAAFVQMSKGTLIPIKEKGFVHYGIEKENGYRVIIEMLDNDGKKLWTKTSGFTQDKKSYESIAPYYSDANYVVSGILSRKQALSTNWEGITVCHNAITGKEVFKIPSNQAQYDLFTEGVSYDETSGEFLIFGTFSKPKDIVSLGIYIQVVDKQGVLKKEIFSRWDQEISAATPSAVKNKLDKHSSIVIHEIIRVPNGQIFAIGEQFHPSINPGKVEIGDLVVYEFDHDFKISNVHLFEKNKTIIELPQGMGVLNGTATIGYYLKDKSLFDYSYTTTSPDKTTFNIVYVYSEKFKDESSKFSVGSISYSNKKLDRNTIDLSSTAYLYWTKPTIPGYICIFECFRKTKQLNIRMEKITP